MTIDEGISAEFLSGLDKLYCSWKHMSEIIPKFYRDVNAFSDQVTKAWCLLGD